MMNLREIDRLVGKEIFGVQELTVEEAVEKFAKKSFRTFTHDGCIVDKYTKLKFDKWEYNRRFNGGYYIPTWKQWLIENSTVETTYPPYSSNMNEAWQVVEKLRETKIFSLFDAWDEDDNKIFCANFEYNDTYHVVDYKGYADTAPLAICLAALKAVGVEVEVNEQ
jgi:hypothetical protein